MNVVRYAVSFWPYGTTWAPGPSGRLLARLLPPGVGYISNMPGLNAGRVVRWILDPLTGMVTVGIPEIIPKPGHPHFPYGYDVEPDHP